MQTTVGETEKGMEIANNANGIAKSKQPPNEHSSPPSPSVHQNGVVHASGASTPPPYSVQNPMTEAV